MIRKAVCNEGPLLTEPSAAHSEALGLRIDLGPHGPLCRQILHVNKGESLSLQYHGQKDETLYLLSGEVRLTLQKDGENRQMSMQPGDAYHIPARLIHGL